MIEVQHIDHVAIAVRDVERSAQWYAETLGLEKTSPWDGEPVMMSAGDTSLALFSVEGPGLELSGEERDRHLVALHVAFRVDRAGFDGARNEFKAKGMSVRFADHGVCHSIYIDDPDGHTIELTTYEV